MCLWNRPPTHPCIAPQPRRLPLRGQHSSSPRKACTDQVPVRSLFAESTRPCAQIRGLSLHVPCGVRSYRTTTTSTSILTEKDVDIPRGQAAAGAATSHEAIAIHNATETTTTTPLFLRLDCMLLLAARAWLNSGVLTFSDQKGSAARHYAPIYFASTSVSWPAPQGHTT